MLTDGSVAKAAGQSITATLCVNARAINGSLLVLVIITLVMAKLVIG